ncbi:MAG: divalent-cation tolerance protein CutA [Candidatus Methylopumilus sp.]
MPDQSGNDAILVLTSLPDTSSAEKLAEFLIGEQLAACINILAPCTSIYQWQGKLEKSNEIPLMIKTTTCHYERLEQAILNHHPYELPEIIYVSIEGGLPAYLAWLAKVNN